MNSADKFSSAGKFHQPISKVEQLTNIAVSPLSPKSTPTPYRETTLPLHPMPFSWTDEKSEQIPRTRNGPIALRLEGKQVTAPFFQLDFSISLLGVAAKTQIKREHGREQMTQSSLVK